MARQPRHCDHRGHLPHFPLYDALVRSDSRTGDTAHISLSLSFRMLPMGMPNLLHGVSVPSGRIVMPETPAAQPPRGTSVFPSSTSSPICDATGSPVAMWTLSFLISKTSPYTCLNFSFGIILSMRLFAPAVRNEPGETKSLGAH